MPIHEPSLGGLVRGDVDGGKENGTVQSNLWTSCSEVRGKQGPDRRQIAEENELVVGLERYVATEQQDSGKVSTKRALLILVSLSVDFGPFS